MPARAASPRCCKRADEGDRRCIAALAGAGEALGFAIANLITLFAPPKVIISGRAIGAERAFPCRALRRTVANLLPPSFTDVADIVVREWSDSLWVRGAAAMTLRDLYGAPWGTTGPASPRETLRDGGDGIVTKPVGIGVIGCGNISPAYLKAAKNFAILNIVALADARPEAAEARAAEFGLKAKSLEALLADPEVEIVLNLTVPNAHVEVGLQALAAGKHVYSEKPLGVTLARGARTGGGGARRRALRLGSAPDTFLGGAHQTARALIDEGRHRPPGRRNRLLHVPRPRALASQSRLLLSRRRRPDARHGALLHHRSRQPARAGGERHRRRDALAQFSARSSASR